MDDDKRMVAMGQLSGLRMMLSHLPSDAPEREDVEARLLIAAADALNAGAEARTVQALGVFSDIEIKKAEATALEFRTYDAELEVEEAERRAAERPIGDTY